MVRKKSKSPKSPAKRKVVKQTTKASVVKKIQTVDIKEPTKIPQQKETVPLKRYLIIVVENGRKEEFLTKNKSKNAVEIFCKKEFPNATCSVREFLKESIFLKEIKSL